MDRIPIMNHSCYYCFNYPANMSGILAIISNFLSQQNIIWVYNSPYFLVSILWEILFQKYTFFKLNIFKFHIFNYIHLKMQNIYLLSPLLPFSLIQKKLNNPRLICRLEVSWLVVSSLSSSYCVPNTAPLRD